MDRSLEAYHDDDPTTAELAALPCHRDIIQDMRSHAPFGLHIPDTAQVDVGDMEV
jgi:hypothetical protein